MKILSTLKNILSKLNNILSNINYPNILRKISYPKLTAAILLFLGGFVLTSSYFLSTVIFFLISFIFAYIIFQEAFILKRQHKEALHLLGFKSNENPDEKAIKVAYVERALVTHPEYFPQGTTKEQATFLFNKKKTTFIKLGQAYLSLSNQAVNEVNFEDADALFFNTLDQDEVRKLKLQYKHSK